MSSTEHTLSRVKSLDDRIQYWLLVILRLSVVVAMGLALYYRDLWAFLYSILALGLMYLPWLVRSKVKINLPIEFDFVLVIFMYMAVFLGKAGGAYDHFWWWDVVLHTSSGFIIGFIAFLILYIKVKQKKLHASRMLIGLLIFSVGLAFGALWEVFEYGLALVFGGNLTVDGFRDTIQDLIVDGVGALIMAWVGVQQIFDERRGFIIRWAETFVRMNPIFKKDHRRA
jgi:hypothetical protein